MRLLISITIIGITLFSIVVAASSVSSTTSVDPKSMRLSRRTLHLLSKRGKHKHGHHGKKDKHEEEEKKEEKKENNSDGGKSNSNQQPLIPGNLFQQSQSFIPTIPTLPTLSTLPALPSLPTLPNLSNLFGTGGS